MKSQILLLFAAFIIPSTFSCRQKQDTSQTQIASGEDAKDRYLASVNIQVLQHENASSWTSCSATFISDHVLITAAHCIDEVTDLSTGKWNRGIIRVSGGPTASFAYAHPQTTHTGNVDAHDLAIVIFPKDSWKHYRYVNTQTPQIGTCITMVGFGGDKRVGSGMVSGGKAGIKRIGRNALHDFRLPSHIDPSSGMMILNGGKNVAECDNGQATPGDSGSGAFAHGALIGVLSGGDGFKNGGESFLININSKLNAEFIGSAIAKHEAFICGWNGVECPDAEVSTYGLEPEIERGDALKRLFVRVAEGTDKNKVAIELSATSIHDELQFCRLDADGKCEKTFSLSPDSRQVFARKISKVSEEIDLAAGSTFQVQGLKEKNVQTQMKFSIEKN